MYLRNLEMYVLKYRNLICKIFLAPGLVWQAALKKAKVNLDLVTNIDMLLITKKGLYMNDCDTNK